MTVHTLPAVLTRRFRRAPVLLVPRAVDLGSMMADLDQRLTRLEDGALALVMSTERGDDHGR